MDVKHGEPHVREELRMWRKKALDLEAEIERLTAALKSADIIIDGHVAENLHLQARVEELEAELSVAKMSRAEVVAALKGAATEQGEGG